MKNKNTELDAIKRLLRKLRYEENRSNQSLERLTVALESEEYKVAILKRRLNDASGIKASIKQLIRAMKNRLKLTLNLP